MKSTVPWRHSQGHLLVPRLEDVLGDTPELIVSIII